MDRTLGVRTPESIQFSYELAGVGSRFLAVTIDLLVQVGIVILFAWGLALATNHAAKVAFAKGHVSSSVASSVGVAIVVATLFLIFFGYFIFFEAFWNGQTPGKKALGIRVVRDGGYPLDWAASLVRNLIRVGEMIAGFYAISAVVAVLSPQNKRLGDLAAGTVVVRDSKMESPQALLRDMAAPVYAATAYVSGEERALIRRFLERRGDLVAERRIALAHRLAERVRPRVPPELRTLADEDLLERL
jgi:uncharacterized RDD family membrane protein YckC